MKPDIRWAMTRLFIPQLALSGLLGGTAVGQSPAAPDSPADSAGAAWPRQVQSGATTFSVYQPQVESWAGNQLATRAAVAVRDSGASAEPRYGVVWVSARTDVDKTSRQVSLDDFRITRSSFPSAGASAGPWAAELQRLLPRVEGTVALDQLESGLAVQQQVAKARETPLRDTPPRIIFSDRPAILVLIDGQPVLRPAGNGIQRVINTRPLLLQDNGRFYLHVFDGWMQASALVGPWSMVTAPPAALAAAMQAAVSTNQVDLLTGDPADSTAPAPTLAAGTAPDIYVSTEPAELVVTAGEADYVPVDGTRLLYVENTTGRVFKSIADNQTYLLISGRWYRGPSEQGPWAYIRAKDLPADFAAIPDSSAVENVKASVPGTTEAQEAAIANSIPQTATVKRAGTTLDPAPTIDGDPQLRPIAGTSLQYVLNASLPIIETGPAAYYAVQNGVWFVAPSVRGPWVVAASVPAEIYAIPPSSPLYYVTFVQVYGATSDVAYVGYTPGYFGTVLDPDGIVVYGTGYDYEPWVGRYWFGFPCTYGFGADVRWTPWTGWGFGFGFGWSWGRVGMAWGGWGWGPRPWWGPSAWLWSPHFHGHSRGRIGFARGGWAGSSIDVYARWRNGRVMNRAPSRPEAWAGGKLRGRVGVAYNSRTGFVGAGQRVPIRSIYRGATAPRVERPADHIGVAQRGGGRFAGRPNVEVPGSHPQGRTAPERPAPRPVPERQAPRPVPERAAPRPVPERPAPRPVPQRPLPIAAPTGRGVGLPQGDLYAGPRGQVMRRAPTGGWDQHAGDGWQHVGAAPQLDREAQARAEGAQRSGAVRSALGAARGGFGGGDRAGGGTRAGRRR